MAKNWKRAYENLFAELGAVRDELWDVRRELENEHALRQQAELSPKIPFAFALSQRVTVPNSAVQGMVVGASAGIGGENSYLVSALTDEGRNGTVAYGEAVLLAAQTVAPANTR